MKDRKIGELEEELELLKSEHDVQLQKLKDEIEVLEDAEKERLNKVPSKKSSKPSFRGTDNQTQTDLDMKRLAHLEKTVNDL